MITITPSLLRHAAICDRRLWLDYHAEQPEPTPVMAYRTGLGNLHECETQEPAETVSVASWDDGVGLTQQWMFEGVPVIQNGFLQMPYTSGVMLRGRPDRLTRTADGYYTPGEIKRYSGIGYADLLQLDFYCVLAGVARGEFWMGQPVQRIPHMLDEDRLYRTVDRVVRLLKLDEPEVRIEPHCKECPWYGGCFDIARQSGDLSLISGLRRDSREALRAQGIRSLEHLASLTPDELRSIKGIKSTAASIRAGAESLWRGEPVWYARLHATATEPGVMFDLETDPATGTPWSLGWFTQGEPHVALVGRGPNRQFPDGTHVHVRRTPDEAWWCMAEALAGEKSPIFHWTGYDLGVLKSTAPADVRDALAPRFFDLHRAFSQSVRFPVDGTSLKRVAAYLGYSWGAYESWFAAWEDYRAWLRTDDDTALQRSLRYQMDDVIALGKVWEWLVASR